MNATELARKYYPRLWPAERLAALVAAGKLTQAEVDEIMEEEAHQDEQ